MTSTDSLHEIGIGYHTDKAVFHYFTVLYGAWFAPLRDKPIRMLEIGILLGSSLRMWHEYFFRHERIYAADLLFPEERGIAAMDLGPTVELIRLDQSNREQLATLPRDLDLIIDDGGHTPQQQQHSLAVLFDHLKPGGTYVIEDLHTSLPYYEKSHGCTPRNNTLRLLLDLQAGKQTPGTQYFLAEGEFQRLYDQIQEIEIVYVKHDSITSRIRRWALPVLPGLSSSG